ncbi:MAG: glycosyltransferase [Ruminococcaceae bacterium]|nr:glycosyltransferase [Oscillospiraceae bacterium]
MPKVSVIVPVYNSEKYLRKCLDTLVGQTLEDIEIIVVNDGSPDNSQTIIDEYAEKYPEKIVSLIQENRGQSAARNNGIAHATGEYIAFVDSDDYIELHALATSYEYAKNNGLDIVCFDYWIVNGDSVTFNDHCRMDSDEADIKYLLNEASPWNKLISRRIFSEHGVRFLENIIYEDLEMIARLVLYTDKIGYINEALYFYIIHEGSTMRLKKYNEKLASIYKVMDSLTNSFEGTKYDKEGVLEYMYIEHLLHLAVYRYLDYPEGAEDIRRIAAIMKERYPNWRKNKYYKRCTKKLKIFCELAARKQIKLLKLIMKK